MFCAPCLYCYQGQERLLPAVDTAVVDSLCSKHREGHFCMKGPPVPWNIAVVALGNLPTFRAQPIWSSLLFSIAPNEVLWPYPMIKLIVSCWNCRACEAPWRGEKVRTKLEIWVVGICRTEVLVQKWEDHRSVGVRAIVGVGAVDCSCFIFMFDLCLLYAFVRERILATFS